MRQLFPLGPNGPAIELSPTQAANVDDRRPPPGRPWVELCMVASVDGSTSLGQLSGGLSSPADVAMLSALRSAADVILVGAGTVRAEGYGPPRRPGQRIAVVSNSAAVDLTTDLFRSGAGVLVVPEDAAATEVETIRCGRSRVDIRQALGLIGERLGAGVVHAEGGPTLNAALAADDLIDELNLTISPALVGGGGARLIDGGVEISRALRLDRLLVDGDFLFSRWLRAAGASSAD